MQVYNHARLGTRCRTNPESQAGSATEESGPDVRIVWPFYGIHSLFMSCACAMLCCGGSIVQDTSRTPPRAVITSGFWRRYQTLDYEQVIPYQWKALNDEIEGAPKSYAVQNLKIAAGMHDGEYAGLVFQDSDLAKWIEAAGHALTNAQNDPDFPEEIRRVLEQWIDQIVGVLSAAQQPDGYLNSYFIVKAPEHRWGNLREAHELYCAGHLIEAGVAVYKGTGDRTLLDVVIRLADHIDSVFGRGPGRRRGYPGHQEIELALVKLYRATGERRFLDLAGYFVEERGRKPYYFEAEAASPGFHPIWSGGGLVHEYQQSHAPVREQKNAVGHSVRAMYQYIAMADLAFERGDTGLADTCRELWNDVTGRKMYVTGAIGASPHGEQFAGPWDLPNDMAYAETCASIGLFIFANRMAQLDNDARFADVAERALYNGVISGLALDGAHYFYVNPLHAVPDVCDSNPTHSFVKYRRQAWYGCACCPPNLARIIASLGEYTIRVQEDTLYVDHFVSGRVHTDLTSGGFGIDLEGNYPWDGAIAVTVTESPDGPVELAVRLPDWCSRPALRINGEPVEIASVTRRGYAALKRRWSRGDTLQIDLPMEVRRIVASPLVQADYGRLAVQRGPLVYCLEAADNGPNLHAALIDAEPDFRCEHREGLLGGVTVIFAAGRILPDAADNAAPLYSAEAINPPLSPCRLTFIPYYAWANREAGEMIVWVRDGRPPAES